MGTTAERQRTRRARTAAAAAVVATALVLLAACTPGGGDDDADPDPGGKGSTGQGDDTTTTTLAPDGPAGSDVAAVQPVIEDLLDHYAEAVTTILGDPSVARDRGNRTVAAFVAVFEDDSDFADDSLAAWLDYADKGITLVPVSSDHPTVAVNIDGAVRPINDDELRFAYCEVQRYIYKVDGQETERQDERLVPGTGQAVRVDGRWRLRSLETPPDLQGCFSGTEGT